MENLVLSFITLYGPLGMGWGVAAVLYISQTRERREWVTLLSSQTEAFNKNTLAVTELVTYLKAKMD